MSPAATNPAARDWRWAGYGSGLPAADDLCAVRAYQGSPWAARIQTAAFPVSAIAHFIDNAAPRGAAVCAGRYMCRRTALSAAACMLSQNRSLVPVYWASCNALYASTGSFCARMPTSTP